MTATSIDSIYNDFRTSYQNNSPDFTIDFYQNNAVLLNNVKTFRDSEQLRLYIELTWQFLNAKHSKCHFNDIIETVNQKRLLIDSEISRLDSDKLKDDWYYGIIFFQGMSIYNLNDYKTATPIFKELVKYDSKNDRYKNWLNYSLYGQRLWLSRTITIVCGVLLFIEIFFSKLLHLSPLVGLWIDGIALSGIIFTLGYDYYIKNSFRKTKGK